ncbi:cupin domain-containing protein [Chachezhania antarctica]|uniref:cupin domain-containing protein n=1 Tax=Chachezhania antarctica TaxID=2340860 RepID=UPI000EB17A12|nr:cupin domain-containing protein [Chachezhania antarctica]|tara:strand:- start:5239 stop:5595 length:357 start_codon:yes stop_codon:yes gene_type:complete
MTDLSAFTALADTPLGPFASKPTTLTDEQEEASAMLWQAPDGHMKIGVWECTPGHFTADRTAAGEYCHILSGRASVTNADGSGAREIGPGDLLVLPKGWSGEWVIHEHMRKLFLIDAG